MMRRAAGVVAALVLCAMDDAPVRAQAEAIVIENVAVVDVVKGRLTAPQTVIIAEGRIASMGRLETAAPPDAVRVDGSGRYLMPGLVDMHVHLFNNATHRPPNDWAFPLWVANGVTGVRDMRSELSDLPTIARWRDAVGRHQLIAPRVLAAGLAPNTGSEETARQAVQDAHAAGADFIKIFSNVSESLWHTILEKARDVNLPVCGHVPAEVSARTAASAGQRSNEHLTQVYEACSRKEQEFLAKRRGLNGNEAARIRDEQEGEVLAAFDEKVCTQTAEHLAKTRQVQVPTLVLPWVEAQPRRKSFRDDPHWNLLRADEQARWEGIIEQEPAEITETARRRWEVSREIVRIMERAEVRILAGTDSPMPLVYPGWAVHKELELLVESGLSAAEALRSATIWPAEFLNVNQSRGSIAVGKDADLVLLDADPLREIGNTRLIHAVVLEGRLLLRADLDALLRGK